MMEGYLVIVLVVFMVDLLSYAMYFHTPEKDRHRSIESLVCTCFFSFSSHFLLVILQPISYIIKQVVDGIVDITQDISKLISKIIIGMGIAFRDLGVAIL